MITFFYDSFYKGLSVITSRGPLVEEYLERTHVTLMRALAQHPRLMAARVDLRFPNAYWPVEGKSLGNDYIKRFTESLESKILHSQHVARCRGVRVHPTSVRVIWAREYRQDERKPHFHLMLLLNRDAFHVLGDYLSHNTNLMSRIVEAWASSLGVEGVAARGAVYVPENPIYHVEANEHQSIADCFYRASYLCKVETKKFHGGFHPFGNSRR